MLFQHNNPSLSFVTPTRPSLDATLGIDPGNSYSGQTRSASSRRRPALPGWILAKQILCVQFASIGRRAFSSMGLAAALFIAYMVAAPAAAQSTLTVTTMADVTHSTPDCSSGTGSTCSLRDAIGVANKDNNGDTIQFLPKGASVVPFVGNLELTKGTLVISAGMTIQGPGANLLTISGGHRANSAQSGSTVIAITGGGVTISGLTIADGYANYSNSGSSITINGGGIFIVDGIVSISQCTIARNIAGGLGGGIYQFGGMLSIQNSTISGNSASIGAGIYNNGGGTLNGLSISESTIAGNSAQLDYGAIYSNGTLTLNLNDSTISGNSAAVATGGVGLGTSSLAAFNSIIAGNTSPSANAPVDCDNCGTQNSFNLIGGSAPLGPLAWNGGPTQTMSPVYNQYGIIGEGNPSYVPGGTLTDQLGFPLPSNGKGGVDWPFDFGAVQTHFIRVNSNDDTITSGDCAPTGGPCTLRKALALANTNGAGDINFSVTGSIPLSSGQPLPAVTVPLNLIGPGASSLTIDGQGSSKVDSIFTINPNLVAAISGITITGANAASGGAINSQSALALVADTFTGNTAGEGGAITANNTYAANSSLMLMGSTVSGNTSSGYSGGGLYILGVPTIISGSTISGNTATYDGGGLAVSDDPILLVNTTIAENSSQEGAGFVYGCNGSSTNPTLFCSMVMIDDSTISANTASYKGGGFYNGGGTTLALTINDSILAGNTSNGSPDDCDNCSTNLGAGNLIGGDPKLGSLAVNGTEATVQTMIPLPGSPAIGEGNPTAMPTGLATDERGFPRFTGSSSSLDLGAVQTNSTSVVFETQPSTTGYNMEFYPTLAVQVLEKNTATSTIDGVNGVPVTLSYSGGASAILGTLTQTSEYGHAFFLDLIPKNPGTGNTFTVASPVIGGKTVTSNAFTVTATTAVTVGAATTSTSASAQNVTLTATLTAAKNATLNQGSVAFTVMSGSTAVGTATSGSVTNGVATVRHAARIGLRLPPGIPLLKASRCWRGREALP